MDCFGNEDVKIKERNKNIQNMEGIVFSTYTNTVREIFADTDESIAKFIFDGNIYSVGEPHDDWNGGVDFYHIVLRLPVKVFKQLEKKGLLKDYETALQNSYYAAMRGVDSTLQLTDVFFQPVSEDNYTLGDDADTSMWANGYFRLFISHLTVDKQTATNLKTCIKSYGIDCFVAHEDIRVSREWQTEIENALFTMDALCAIVTKDFKKSDWCDQEVGIALGQKKPVLPISKEAVPYGFFGKYQALNSKNKSANDIAFALWTVITENGMTAPIYFDNFLSLIVNSATTKEALDRLKTLRNCQKVDRNVAMSLRKKYQETSVMNEKEVVDCLNGFFEEHGVDKIKISSAAPVLNEETLPF